MADNCILGPDGWLSAGVSNWRICKDIENAERREPILAVPLPGANGMPTARLIPEQPEIREKCREP